MKTIATVVLALFATITMNSQELEPLKKVNVPMSYTEGLLKEYPNAKDIKWDRLNDNYKVSFEDGELERTIHFNKQGDKVRIDSEMVTTKLPVTLSDAIKKDYSDYYIDSVHSITKNGVTTYEVVLHKKDWVEEIILRYNSSGEVLRESKF